MNYTVHARMEAGVAPSEARFGRYAALYRFCKAASIPLAAVAYLGALIAPAVCMAFLFQVLRWIRLSPHSIIYWSLVGFVAAWAVWFLYRTAHSAVRSLRQGVVDLDAVVAFVAVTFACGVLVWVCPTGGFPPTPNKALQATAAAPLSFGSDRKSLLRGFVAAQSPAAVPELCC